MINLRQYLDMTRCEDDLKELIELIAMQAIPIRNAFFTNQSYATSVNASGERQAALDDWADARLLDVLGSSGLVAELASEEQPEIVKFPDARTDYAVVLDPLDGSSLIQVNLAVGTIAGIYGGGTVMQRGEQMKAALYMLYGPMTVLCLSVGEGVFLFAMNEEDEYLLMEGQVLMPEGTIYGSGGLKKDWIEPHRLCIEELESGGCKLRYSGSFVADFHQVLKYGGMYCYPAVKGRSSGKLRLLFEANPIGFLAMQAGGGISDGTRNILTISPEAVHQRTPIYVGSKGLIKKIEEMMNRQR
jgi:fructose-1,6-bisphosphatase I